MTWGEPLERIAAYAEDTPPDPPMGLVRQPDRAIEERFLRFHRDHPEVYEHLVTLCRQARSTGRRTIGIGMLWEVLRWNRIIAGLPDPGEDRKLNDHYRSRYARLIMAQEPGLGRIFEIRQLRSP